MKSVMAFDKLSSDNIVVCGYCEEGKLFSLGTVLSNGSALGFTGKIGRTINSVVDYFYRELKDYERKEYNGTMFSAIETDINDNYYISVFTILDSEIREISTEKIYVCPFCGKILNIEVL